MRRVVVTGLGAVTPLGLDAPSTWEAAVAGRSGVGLIRAFDASEFPVRIASEVKGFEPEAVVGPKDARRLERNVVLAVAAAREAWADAGVEGIDPARAGILVGSAIGGVIGVLEQDAVLRERGHTRGSRRGSCRTCSSTPRAGRSRSTSGCAGRTTRPSPRARPARTR